MFGDSLILDAHANDKLFGGRRNLQQKDMQCKLMQVKNMGLCVTLFGQALCALVCIVLQ